MTSSLSRIRFGSNRGRFDPGADQHEGAGPHQLGQPGLHRRGLAGALEHDVDGVVDDAGRARPCSARRARRGGAPGWRRPRGASCLAAGGGLDAADVVDAHRAQRGDAERADRSGTEDEHPLAAAGPRPGGCRAARPTAARPAPRRAGRGRRASAAPGWPRAACRWRRRRARARCRACRWPRRATAGWPCTSRHVAAAERSGRRRPGRRAAQRVTPSPTAAIVPIHSWPCQLPGTPQPSSTMCRSLPQMPHSSTATSTSSAPTSGTGTCSTTTSPAVEHGRRHRLGKGGHRREHR